MIGFCYHHHYRKSPLFSLGDAGENCIKMGLFLWNSVRNLLSASLLLLLGVCFSRCQPHTPKPRCEQEKPHRRFCIQRLAEASSFMANGREARWPPGRRSDGKVQRVIGHTWRVLLAPRCTIPPILFNNLIYIFLSGFLAAGSAARKMDWNATGGLISGWHFWILTSC